MAANPDLEKLAEVFKKYPEIQAVYLFGSAAEGNLRPGSDLDLAIFPCSESLRKKKLEILTGLAELGFCNVDLVFMNENDIVLQYEVVRHNRVVYQTSEFDRGRTYSKIIRQYFDFQPYLTIQREAYKERIRSGQA